MKTIYDVQQLLRKFGTFIYVGDRLADLELMEQEIKELNESQFLSKEDFLMATLLVRQAAQKERDKREQNN
jgi:uncharacterized protein YqgQ